MNDPQIKRKLLRGVTRLSVGIVAANFVDAIVPKTKGFGRSLSYLGGMIVIAMIAEVSADFVESKLMPEDLV